MKRFHYSRTVDFIKYSWKDLCAQSRNDKCDVPHISTEACLLRGLCQGHHLSDCATSLGSRRWGQLLPGAHRGVPQEWSGPLRVLALPAWPCTPMCPCSWLVPLSPTRPLSSPDLPWHCALVVHGARHLPSRPGRLAPCGSGCRSHGYPRRLEQCLAHGQAQTYFLRKMFPLVIEIEERVFFIFWNLASCFVLVLCFV